MESYLFLKYVTPIRHSLRELAISEKGCGLNYRPIEFFDQYHIFALAVQPF